jgi:hypothetical protein
MDAFDDIITKEFLSDAETDDDIYGLRVLYYDPQHPDARMTAMIPWLTYDRNTADRMRHTVANNGVLLQAALRRAKDTNISWVPMAVRVVMLAEIPF